MLPTFSLRQSDLPEVLMWGIGEVHYIVLKVKVVSKSVMTGLPEKSDQSKMEATFETQGVRALTNKPVDADSLAKQDFENVIADVKSGKM
jgi:hypothetical protein